MPVRGLLIEYPQWGGPPAFSTDTVEMRTQVLEVDNAREKVRDGLIYGIRSTNTPQDHLSSRAAYF
jgi:hypothetical protein